ncbi:conjugal transfer protein TraG [Pedobacter yonginense]|uniref:Conjugal transfer protein TraG n=1 Tax=Pedobacter yonginense TaxID=651869 RepID=A0A317EH53_9SPHI|nr:conjugal transfer protein MobC [Pedobacter yonginense]PWS26151.1 conjugal transfer protein TraG [Pedobacter yonginense]
MNTGEDSTGLRKILDLSRMISVFLLGLHFYISFYTVFCMLGWRAPITDRVIGHLYVMPVFKGWFLPKVASLVFLLISLLGVKGRKDEKITGRKISLVMFAGFLLYFGALLLLYIPINTFLIASVYIFCSLAGFLAILASGTWVSRRIKNSLKKDIFNSENETFPQEERQLENEYSVNLPAKYRYNGENRNSWINFINLFRGLLVSGTPGAGKSYFVIRHVIEQLMKKGFCMFIYDFKYDDLSRIAYNALLKNYDRFPVKPKFYVINFDDLNRTHRCNPLDPAAMEDITDATEASRTIMMGLNRDWIKKQGDFFVESPINFLTAIIWYLKKYKDGRYCTLPHVIELMQADYDQLFKVLQTQEEIKVLINPFISAYQNKAMAQLEGQIASAKIGLARLSSPQLYYVLSGNDFTLDVNNPDEPKIICIGNNPQKLQVYGAVLSLYISRMIKLVNRKGQQKSALIFDEFPTIYFNNMDSVIATARSNKVANILSVQDFSQLKKDYGSEQADVITGIIGNIISGQVTGATAKNLSETFGKIMQDRQSKSINSNDISISQSTQLDYAIPASKISTLSSGEFVGLVADNPEEQIRLKMFHAEIQNDHSKMAEEEKAFKQIPLVKQVSLEEVKANYDQIKMQVSQLIEDELGKINAMSESRENSDTNRSGKKHKEKKGNRNADSVKSVSM